MVAFVVLSIIACILASIQAIFAGVAYNMLSYLTVCISSGKILKISKVTLQYKNVEFG